MGTQLQPGEGTVLDTKAGSWQSSVNVLHAPELCPSKPLIQKTLGDVRFPPMHEQGMHGERWLSGHK